MPLSAGQLGPLQEEDLRADPFEQFTVWFNHARSAGVSTPEAMVLATASPDGIPSARFVLLKEYDEHGFVFCSNYLSRKGRELAANPHAALVFYWQLVGRSVRIEGDVAHTSVEESARFVRERPRTSQLSALASPQSQVIEGRDVLEERVAHLAIAHENGDLPVPAHWGGFRVQPTSFEFWQRDDKRLHDRLRYVRLDGEGWRIERLAP